jgi:hypothetical protein
MESATLCELLLAEVYKPLINYENQLGSEADLAVPTPDHYLPLLYITGRARGQSLYHFRSKEWMAGRFPCLQYAWDEDWLADMPPDSSPSRAGTSTSIE